MRRSAFTYCEDEYPSRLDLGKHKYGGPFTTREVEDVKAFISIVKVLFSLFPVFMLQTVMQATLPEFSRHSNVFREVTNETTKQVHIEGIARHIFISNGVLSPCLVVICIPLYLCFIRPRILYHIPGMFKRIGVAIVLMFLSLLSAFVMDFMVHAKKTQHANCMFKSITNSNVTTFNATDYPSPPLFQTAYFFIPQYIVSSVVNMLMDIAVFEFICSQSPYSMRGLVWGLFFSLKSFSEAVAMISAVPFGTLWKEGYVLSCGSSFYLMYAIIAVLTLVLFSYMTRRYKFRIMNEPSNEYRYAEEYYSNIQ